jgi:NADH:ubiquinone oxidoreductase subunit F (NADH-binding)
VGPYAVLEGAAIAAYTCGAEQVFIYIRGEYRHAYERLARAIEEVARRDAFGDGARQRHARLAFELRRGAGAYICGEETGAAQLDRGESAASPRSKPPFPVHHGLFGCRPSSTTSRPSPACP